MPQFLFIIEIPKDDHTISPSHESIQWQAYEAECDKEPLLALKKMRISRNVWLFDCENTLPDLLELSGLAKKQGLIYKTYLISGDVTLMTKR